MRRISISEDESLEKEWWQQYKENLSSEGAAKQKWSFVTWAGKQGM